MAAPKHIPDAVIKKIWSEYGPNITRSADALGMQRKHLRASLYRLGLLSRPSPAGVVLLNPSGAQSTAGPLTDAEGFPTFPSVSQELVRLEQKRDEMVERVRELRALKKPPVPMVKNAEAALIQSARRRLSAMTDSDLDGDALLALLIQRYLPKLEAEIQTDYERTRACLEMEPEPEPDAQG